MRARTAGFVRISRETKDTRSHVVYVYIVTANVYMYVYISERAKECESPSALEFKDSASSSLTHICGFCLSEIFRDAQGVRLLASYNE